MRDLTEDRSSRGISCPERMGELSLDTYEGGSCAKASATPMSECGAARQQLRMPARQQAWMSSVSTDRLASLKLKLMNDSIVSLADRV